MSGVEQHDRLTGGTFFVLVLEALKPRQSKRSTLSGKSDGLNATEVLVGLHRIVLPSFSNDMKGSTFKQSTSAFKHCKNDGSSASYIEFGTVQFTQDCHKLTASLPDQGLRRAKEFVDKFLDPDRYGTMLVRYLLTLVSRDQTIPDSAVVCYTRLAEPMNKAELLNSNRICLEGLLLGLWCYAATETKNVDGRATFERWHKEAEPHAQRNFDQAAFAVEFPEASCERYAESATPDTSDEGLSCDNTQLKDEVVIDDADAIDEEVIEAEIVDEEEPADSIGEEDCSEQTAQVPNMIFQQFGSNNLQFGSVGTINIGRNF